MNLIDVETSRGGKRIWREITFRSMSGEEDAKPFCDGNKRRLIIILLLILSASDSERLTFGQLQTTKNVERLKFGSLLWPQGVVSPSP